MRFSDYLWGKRIVIDSALPPQQIANRLEAVLPPRWTRLPLGPAGWVAFGRFGLRHYRSKLFRREWNPVLTGRIRAEGEGSRITMNYRIQRWLLLLIPFWACLLFSVISDAPVPQMYQVLFLISSTAVLLGALGIRSTLHDADENLPVLLAVVEAAAGRTA